MSFFRSERGAVAVEFALVLPILLMLLVGIMEFGKAYNTQISLTHTARETARSMVVNNDKAEAEATGIAAAGPMSPRPSTAVPSLTMATVFGTQV